MRRFAIAALFLCAVVAVPSYAGVAAGDTPPPAQQDPAAPAQPSKPKLVRTVVHRPARHRVVRRTFTPPAHPAPSYVFGVIAPAEAEHWGASLAVLSCRIRRESHGQYWAANGQYEGVGQFAPSTFSRGLRTMPHAVTLAYRKDRIRRTRVARIYSDGHVVHRIGRKVRQHVLVIQRGRIPRYPELTHAWAQVRIMAQALVGRSAVHAGEWSTKSYCG